MSIWVVIYDFSSISRNSNSVGTVVITTVCCQSGTSFVVFWCTWNYTYEPIPVLLVADKWHLAFNYLVYKMQVAHVQTWNILPLGKILVVNSNLVDEYKCDSKGVGFVEIPIRRNKAREFLPEETEELPQPWRMLVEEQCRVGCQLALGGFHEFYHWGQRNVKLRNFWFQDYLSSSPRFWLKFDWSEDVCSSL